MPSIDDIKRVETENKQKRGRKKANDLDDEDAIQEL
jgi:hypothetical protein